MASARLETAGVIALGANAWLVANVLPLAFAGPRSIAAVLLVAIPIAALAAGVWLTSVRPMLAEWGLFGVFPTLLAAVSATLPAVTVQTPYSAVGGVLAAISLVAFGAGAAHALGRPLVLREAVQKPLGGIAPVDEEPKRRLLRRLLLGLGGVGALAIAMIAPLAGATEGYEAAFGEHASTAATLIVTLAGAIASAVLVFFVGPSLRSTRVAPPTRKIARRRFYGFMVSVVLGLLFYLFYRIVSS
jgi:hypothetical protein